LCSECLEKLNQKEIKGSWKFFFYSS
jgi:hypothetical protein